MLDDRQMIEIDIVYSVYIYKHYIYMYIVFGDICISTDYLTNVF